MEKFGSITASASSVSPPVKSAGSTWDGATANGAGLNLYLSRLSSGQYLGILFLQETHTWHHLTNIHGDGTKISFEFMLRNGTLIQGAATLTNNTLSGTLTGYPVLLQWQVKRETLSGNWVSTTTFPAFAHFDRLEGSFGGWQSKYQIAYPFRRWVPSDFIQVGSNVSFGIGTYGTFTGNN